MNLAAFSVRNRQFTIVLFVAMLAMGVYALRAIPRAEDPTFPIPSFTIVAVYPGASPTDVEQLIVDPIEKRVKELDDIKRIRTTIEDGLARVQVEFNEESDADSKYDAVVREVNALRPSLPAELSRLDVNRFTTAEVNIIQLALVSATAPYHVLEAQSRAFKDALSNVPGVRRAETWGFPKRQVRVSIDLGRLSRLALPLSQVLGAIQGESANIPGGSVDVGHRRFNVKTSGSYQTVDEVRATVVGSAGGATIRLGDVADVAWGYREATHLARYDGKRAVFITANMLEHESISRVRDAIWHRLDELEARLPAGVKLERGFDQSENVSHRLARLTEDFGIAILLVLVTLLPLGLRAAGIVMVSIPLSLAIGIMLVGTAGFTLNQLTIVGFVIALGLLVDDSIVVIENIVRWMRAGYHRAEAAILATKQITLAVLGYTATLIFTFVPLLMLPGGPGKYIRSLPVAVIFAILASLIISLTIVPFLASVFLEETSDERGNVFMRLLTRAIDATYARVLHRAMARPVLTLGVSAALFIGALALIPVVGFSLFPPAGTPQFHITIETPDGSSIAETDSAIRFVERTLLGRPGIRRVFANVGRGNPRVYYNVVPASEKANVGELFVLLNQYDARRTPAFLDSLRTVFDRYPNARIQVKEYENGPQIDAPIAVRIAGENLDTLRAMAARAEQLVAATVGTRSVVNPLRVPRTDLALAIDRGKAGLLGIPTVEVDRTVRLALAGLTAGKVREADGQEYDVTVELPRGERRTLDALDNVYVASFGGGQIPLRQVASLRFASSPPVIQHYNSERSITVSSQVRTGYNTDKVTKQILAKIAEWKLPAGYKISAAGEIASRQESFGGLGTAILLTTFGILTILILEFRTFKGMLIVASVIPLGIIGGIVALLLSGNTLSFTAMIGFVALIGIEIKNSILLVDFTNQLRAEGASLDDAVERAGKIRFLPVVLTTMTAIGGLIPLALQGSALYSPLALVIIGGLLSSTVLSRLVTPVMYKLLPPEIETAAASAAPIVSTAEGLAMA